MIGEVAGGGLVLRQWRSVTDIAVQHNIDVARSPEFKAMIRKLAALEQPTAHRVTRHCAP
jgi:hypothetical protein